MMVYRLRQLNRKSKIQRRPASYKFGRSFGGPSLKIYYNQKQNYIINKEKKKLYKKDKRYENNDEIKNKEKDTQQDR